MTEDEFAQTPRDGVPRLAEILDEQPPAPLISRLKPWILTAAGLFMVSLAACLVGDLAYRPESRIPEPYFLVELGLLSTNSAFRDELKASVAFLDPSERPNIRLFDEAYELAFPRTLADRLFRERNERASIHTARSGEHAFRFLVISQDDNPALIAIEGRTGRRPETGPQGLFLALPDSIAGDNTHLVQFRMALEEALDEGPTAAGQKLSNSEYVLFGPFARGRPETLKAQIADNLVLTHLVREVERAEANVSLVAPAFLLLKAPERGTIRALFLPDIGLIQEPLWGGSPTASLAHELVHAQFDAAFALPSTPFTAVAAYLERVHPRLHGGVVSDLYESLSPAGRAEETLAFLAGAVANRQTKTEPSLQLLQNQNRLAISEPVLVSDIRLLVQLGLLPDCMKPDGDETPEAEITFDYYRLTNLACAR